MRNAYLKTLALLGMSAILSACADEVRIDSGGSPPPPTSNQKAPLTPYVLPEVKNELEGAFARMDIEDDLVVQFQEKLEHERGFDPEAFVKTLSTDAQKSGNYDRVAQYMNIKCASAYKALEGYQTSVKTPAQYREETYLRSALSFSEKDGLVKPEDVYALHVLMVEEIRTHLEEGGGVSAIEVVLPSCAQYLPGER